MTFLGLFELQKCCISSGLKKFKKKNEESFAQSNKGSDVMKEQIAGTEQNELKVNSF